MTPESTEINLKYDLEDEENITFFWEFIKLIEEKYGKMKLTHQSRGKSGRMKRREKMRYVVTLLRENDGELPFWKLHEKMNEKYRIGKPSLWNYLYKLRANEFVEYSNIYNELRGGKDSIIIKVSKGLEDES